ncbi:MAG: dTMP kinase [Brevinematia bacterium]
MIIVFEGIDGSGKTTVSKKIYEELKDVFKGCVFWFSEPSPTKLGSTLKTILTSKEISLTTLEQTLLFTTDRLFLLRNYIIPYNKENKIIIMDRSFISTYAYQIMNIEDENLKKILTTLTELSISEFYIDILFYFDCPSQISFSRIKEKDGIESKGIEFIEKVRRNYLKFIESKHSKVKTIEIINATKNLEDIYNEVRSKVIEKTGYIV